MPLSKLLTISLVGWPKHVQCFLFLLVVHDRELEFTGKSTHNEYSAEAPPYLQELVGRLNLAASEIEMSRKKELVCAQLQATASSIMAHNSSLQDLNRQLQSAVTAQQASALAVKAEHADNVRSIKLDCVQKLMVFALAACCFPARMCTVAQCTS